MKLAGVVILYNPKSDIYRNIESYVNDLNILFIVDNSKYKSIDADKFSCNNIEYIHDGENRGIAYRLNQIIKICISKEYTYLLTMDQDSFFSEGMLSLYKRYIDESNNPTIGMFGSTYYKANNICKEKQDQILITSGSIVNLSISNKVGNFDENLFIDGIDTDFCLNLFKNQYHTIQFMDIKLNHTLGESKLKITPFLKKENRSIHNSRRIYYILRNHLYLRDKHKTQNNLLPWKPVLNEIKNAIMYGNEKSKTIASIIYALIHYKFKKYGK